MESFAISSTELHKSYGSVHALKHCSFDVRHGELFGLIGPDGAGKTTLIRILASLLLPDKGTVNVLGLDPVLDYKQLRKKIGYMPGRFSLYPDLTVRENLDFFASIFGTTVHQNYDLIKDIYSHIEPFEHRRAGNLSGGMKQKLALSCALIHRPEILFLDEPTTGVDAVSRREFWDMLVKLKSQGITILVSTPYMDEAARCDRIAMMLDGQMLQVNTPAEIKLNYPWILLAVKTDRKYQTLTALRSHPDLITVYPFGDKIHVTVDRSDIHIELFLKQQGIDAQVARIDPSVEDVFLSLAGSLNTTEASNDR